MITEFLIHAALAVVPVVLAITLHEAAHGYAALALGDDTARQQGRLSLNPLRHIDRMGTIILPGILLVSQLLTIGRVAFMFGWAKPVPVSAWRFANPRRGMALVAMAGPAMNFFLAWLAALVLPRNVSEADISSPFITLPFYFMLTNLVIGLFNLLPIPPLDGGRIAVGFLPERLARAWAEVERYGLFIVIGAVLILPRVFGIDPVGDAFNYVLPRAFETVFWLAGHSG